MFGKRSTKEYVLFMTDSKENEWEADNWSRLLAFDGIPSLHWNVIDENIDKDQVLDCPHDSKELAGFDIFRLETQHPNVQEYRYGFTPDEILENAPYWYMHCLREFAELKKKHNIRWFVTRGSSVLSRRAAIFAARDLGMEVYCIEDGLFQLQCDNAPAKITFVLTPGAAYYEKSPKEWEETRSDYDIGRFDNYRKWWLSNRRTKYTGMGVFNDMVSSMNVDLPVEFISSEYRTVFFGQLQGDASLFWNAGRLYPEILWRDDTWYKPHPYSTRDMNIWTKKKDRWISPNVNVHQLLPLCDVVAGITTNVCLEAWMYRRRVDVCGNPWYARGGLCFGKDVFHFERFALLDWFIHDVQVAGDDGRRFIQRLHGEVSSRS